MKKRVLSVLAALACILLLAGCGSQPAADPDAVALTETEQQQWLEAAVSFTESVKAAAEDGSYMMSAEDPVYGPVFDSWFAALPDIGTVQEIRGDSVEFTKDGGRIVVHVDGSDHDAEVVLSMGKVDDTYDLTSVAVNVVYSFAELMQQAALNTVLGMGTTFAVLILLALIIMAFGKALNRATEPKKAPARNVEPEAAPAPAVETVAAQPAEEVQADTALIAVIAAAVAAYEGKASAESYVVRSIRKSRRKF